MHLQLFFCWITTDLINYAPSTSRARIFNFDHSYGEYGGDFAIAAPNNPEFMTAYSLNLIRQMATAAGLVFALAPVPGLWSGSVAVSIGAQDLIVLQKPGVTG
jgi:hypothetical protein